MVNNCADKRAPIAVIGLSCRFPGGATSPDKLWNLLIQGQSAWSQFPKDRFDIDQHYHPNSRRQGTISFRGAHFLEDDVFAWDASFFSTAANEAVAIDPQQRMLLEVTYEALESAGIPKESIDGTDTSVFCGSFVKDYEQMCLKDPDDAPQYAATGNGIALMSNRISHYFNLHGPSMTIDTGCSASLVCFHQACQSLLSNESDMAIVAGAGLILTPNTMMPMMGLNFLSPDGKCFTFDARANGYGRGEGIAVLILKRLDDAIRHNDPIRCVVRGSAVNQDGHTPGITVPSMEAQASNIRRVYRNAGLDFNETGFVECHGTGTQAGDWRELKAISETIAKGRHLSNPVIVSSIKPNIGHLEGAAGVAGIVKMILALEHGRIPKHINFISPGNPDIDFENWKIKVPVNNAPWPLDGLRRGSVNCFGFGGTNAHAILDDAAHYLRSRGLSYSNHYTEMTKCEPIDSIKASDKAYLFLYSAHDKDGIQRNALAHAAYLRKSSDTLSATFLRDYSYTLGCRRSMLDWKSFVVARSVEELASALEDSGLLTVSKSVRNESPTFVLAFCGQGAQWAAMGRDLISEVREFRQSIQDASEYLTTEIQSPFDLYQELLKGDETSLIHKPSLSQPATTAVQIALVDLLQAIGITPKAVIGHSSGEIAAAYAKGALSKQDALKIAYHRGRCVEKLDEHHPSVKGAMVAVAASPECAQQRIDQAGCSSTVRVACVNSPDSVTLSGDAADIRKVSEALKLSNIWYRRLKVSVGYHSHHMELAEEAYRQSLRDICPKESDGGPMMFSSVYGGLVESKQLGPEYWVKNMVSPVNFAGAVEALLMYDASVVAPAINGRRGPTSVTANGNTPSTTNSVNPNPGRNLGAQLDVIFEASPHSTLATYITTIVDNWHRNTAQRKPRYIPLLKRNKDSALDFLSALGAAFTQAGVVITNALHYCVTSPEAIDKPKILANMPSYKWNHETKYIWTEVHREVQGSHHANPGFLSDQRQDIIGRPIPTGGEPEAFRFRGFLRPTETPWLRDHVVENSIVYPAAGIVSTIIQGASLISREPRWLESARKHWSGDQRISAFNLRDFVIEKAILVPNTERGQEINIVIQRQSNGDLTEFSALIGTPNGGIHARAIVQIVLSDPNDDESRVRAHQQEASTYYQTLATCLNQKNIPSFYQDLADSGLNYGPIFRGIYSLQVNDDGNKACFGVRVTDSASVMPQGFEYPVTIHPATLDALFQTVASLSANGKEGSMLPTGIKMVSVSTATPKTAGSLMQGYCSAQRFGRRHAVADITASDTKTAFTYVKVRGLQLTQMGGKQIPDNKSLCTRLSWSPDMNLWKKGMVPLIQFISCLAHKKPGLRLLFVQDAINAALVDTLLQGTQEARGIYLGISAVTHLDSHADKTRSYEVGGVSIQVRRLDQKNPLAANDCYDAIILPARSGSLIDALSQNLSEGGVLLIHAEKTDAAEMLELEKAGIINTQSLPQSSHSLIEPLRSSPYSRKSKYKLTPCFLTWSSPSDDKEYRFIGILGLEAKHQPPVLSSAILLASDANSEVQKFAWSLKDALYRRKIDTVVYTVAPGSNIETDLRGLQHCVSLLEMSRPWVGAMEKADFDILKRMLKMMPNVLWVSRGLWARRAETTDNSSVEGHPTMSMVLGLFRTLVSEGWADIRPVSIDLDQRMTQGTLQNFVHDLVDLFLVSFGDRRTYFPEVFEREYAVSLRRHGHLIQTPRLTPLEGINTQIENFDADVVPVQSQNSGTGICAVRAVLNPRNHGGVELVNDLSLRPFHELDKCQVRIVVEDTMILPSDIYQPRDGISDIGIDVFGTSYQVMDDGRHSTGKCYAIVPTGGTLRSVLDVESDMVYKMPDTYSPIHGFSPARYAGVLSALRDAQLNKASIKTVVVHHGADYIGQVAVTFLHHYFRKIVYATVRNFDEYQLLTCHHGVPKQRVFVLVQDHDAFLDFTTKNRDIGPDHVCYGDEGETSLVNKLSHQIDRDLGGQNSTVTNGERRSAAHAVFDHSETTAFTHTLCAANGTLVAWHDQDFNGASRRFVDEHGIIKCFEYSMNEKLLPSNRKKLRPFFGEVIKLMVEDCNLQPVADFQSTNPGNGKNSRLTTLEQIDRALTERRQLPVYHQIKVNFHSGPMAPENFPGCKLSSTGSYIIAGGFGGLGRAIARMLVKLGAKHLALISLNPKLTPERQHFVESLVDGGAIDVQHFAGNLSYKEEAERVLREIDRTMPPIKGVIMAAAIIDDTLFEKMSFSHWTAVVGPKAKGSIYLHSHFWKNDKPKLDFFILLSSAAGIIGNRTQANYNAANLVQDNIAALRSCHGENAISFALGPVMGAGMLERDPELLQRLVAAGFIGVKLKDLEHLIKCAMVPGNVGTDRHKHLLHPNTVVGVGTGGLIYQNDPQDPYWTKTALFSYLNRVDLPKGAEMRIRGAKASEDETKKLEAGWQAAKTFVQKRDFMAQALIKVVVSQTQSKAAEDVDAETDAPQRLGIDSISAIGVRNWLQENLGVSLDVMQMLSDMSFNEQGGILAKLRVETEAKKCDDQGGIMEVDG